MDDDAAYRIHLRAHELWAQGGRPNASSLAFWFAAEAELKSARGFTEAHRVEQGQTSLASEIASRAFDSDPSSAAARTVA